MPDLPSGTVTFLFTDIEGSTKLWEEHPEAMRLALARHDALLRSAIESNGGVVFKTIGDAFCAAFSTPPYALNAALAAQRALAAEPWQEILTLRVRMALHTGTAEVRDNDYFGQPLNRVARLLAVGHGGQVLLSQIVHDQLADTTALLDLGLHRLKDLQQPEHVWQLTATDLASEFPPLRSLSLYDNNLPQQVTSFIGRKKEMAEVKNLLTRNRLLTLTGSGGTGKTRLSLQVAAEVLEQFPDGVWLVELASLADPALVPQTVADVLGVREAPGEPITNTLLGALKEKDLLLVLDNCEHVLEASARLVDALLKSCPKVKLLGSSREALGIAGESAYRVPSLSLPPPGDTYTPDSLSEYEGVRLFQERAVAVKADFVVTPQNAPALASVCRRLDGIPLAIELAAGRVRSMTVEELEKRLDDRFRLLTGGSRTALPRQQTLRALIDWSYDLLEENQKTLLARLCVFSGGFSLDACEQVCAGEGVEAWEVLDLLTALTDKSLVIAEEREGTTRYRLLETVKQYAREKLASTGEAESVRQRHQAFYLALAEDAEPHYYGPDQALWLYRLESEHDNLRAALEGEDKIANLRLAGAIWRFWSVRGYLSEGRARLNEALSQVGEEKTPLRAKALNKAGVMAGSQGDYASARTLFEESLTIQRELGDKQGIANSLNNLGLIAKDEGDFAAARRMHEESLAIRRELGDRGPIAYSLGNLGLLAKDEGDYASARRLLEESLMIKRELGDRHGMSIALNNLGSVVYLQGDFATARTLQEEGLTIQRELGDKQGSANSLGNLGLIARDQGDHASARRLFEESLAQFHELSDKGGIADSLEAIAALAASQGQAGRAVQVWGAAQRLREEIGAPLPPNERAKYDRNMAIARQALGEEAFAAAWAAGRAMTMEQAMEVARMDEVTG